MISYDIKPVFLNDQYLPKHQWVKNFPDSKVHGANMGPTRVLSTPDGPYVGPMNLAVRVSSLPATMATR